MPSNSVKSMIRGGKPMLAEKESNVLIAREACEYLRISRPAYLKYLVKGKIRGTKAGKGWKVLKSELDRFLTGGQWRLRKGSELRTV